MNTNNPLFPPPPPIITTPTIQPQQQNGDHENNNISSSSSSIQQRRQRPPPIAGGLTWHPLVPPMIVPTITNNNNNTTSTTTNNNNNTSRLPSLPSTTATASNNNNNNNNTTTTTTHRDDITTTNQWQEQRENQQRTIRLLMMFLMMLLFMDDDTSTTTNTTTNNNQQQLRGNHYISSDHSSRNISAKTTHPMFNNNNDNDDIQMVSSLYHHRIVQDEILRNISKSHKRYQYLIHSKNHHIDYSSNIYHDCIQQMDIVRDDFFKVTLYDTSSSVSVSSSTTISQNNPNNSNNPDVTTRKVETTSMDDYYSSDNDNHDDDTNIDHHHNNHDDDTINNQKVWHYPWNTTGFYRGSWTRMMIPDLKQQKQQSTTTTSSNSIPYDDINNNVQLLQIHVNIYQQQHNNNNTNMDSSSSSSNLDHPHIQFITNLIVPQYLIEQFNNNHNQNHTGTAIMNISKTFDLNDHEILQLIVQPTNHLHPTKRLGLIPSSGSSSSSSNNTTDSTISTTSKTPMTYYINQQLGMDMIEYMMIQQLHHHTYRRKDQFASIVSIPSNVHIRSTTVIHDMYDFIINRMYPSYIKSYSYNNNTMNMNSYDRHLPSTTTSIPNGKHDSKYDVSSSQQPIKIQSVIENDHHHDTKDANYDTHHNRRNIAMLMSSEQIPSSLPKKSPSITLTRDNGRVAFQLFGQSIIGMKEISIISGFMKLYDSSSLSSSSSSTSSSTGYSTRKDVVIRVRGVLFHSIGRISLISGTDVDSIALVIDPNYLNTSSSSSTTNPISHYQFQDTLIQLLTSEEPPSENTLSNVRNQALQLYDIHKSDQEIEHSDGNDMEQSMVNNFNSSSSTTNDRPSAVDNERILLRTNNADDFVPKPNIWSNIVIPFPFVHDNHFGSLRDSLSLATRNMPVREQALEANAAGCTFEISMDVSEVEWSLSSWKKLLLRRFIEARMMDPSNQRKGDILDIMDGRNDKPQQRIRPYASSSRSNRKLDYSPPEALVMNMIGEIHSNNCNFHAIVNTTALRTDWEATTSKAINYSFYMMLVCLTQILILLRQLLHSQPQSIATRVSVFGIGWQASIDALLCLTHVYLSLAIQPLFTAFVSVAFFKLLIFCVIEMKYMAIIIQARNNTNGTTQNADVVRRQVALLHIRFYAAQIAIVILVLSAPGKYRIYTLLALYSFWVPQIILNIITESKTPLHKNYIYGMSITRLVAPLYMFGLRNNFLREVYPESTTDILMCQLLILWVGIQAATLVAQGKYGARFMIPARFLPPKFDYSRPIPASMLPPGVLLDLPSPESMDDRSNDIDHSKGLTKRNENDIPNKNSSNYESELRVPTRHKTADTTRNRHHRNGGSNLHGMISEETIPGLPKANPIPAPVLECSICYDDIDIRDRFKYMLAPCNHLYHSECLKQWMEVKMECPICRTQLPAL